MTYADHGSDMDALSDRMDPGDLSLIPSNASLKPPRCLVEPRAQIEPSVFVFFCSSRNAGSSVALGSRICSLECKPCLRGMMQRTRHDFVRFVRLPFSAARAKTVKCCLPSSVSYQ